MQTCKVVELYTSKGVLSVELYDKEAPREAEMFVRLAMSGQLDGDTFRTLIPGCVVVGTAGATAEGDTFALLETPPFLKRAPALRHVGAGLLSCPVSRGTVLTSTFVITLSPQPKLDDSYMVFGRVYKGMSLLKDLALAQVRDNFELVTPLSVSRCTVTNLPMVNRPQVEESNTSSRNNEGEVAGDFACHVVRKLPAAALSKLVAEA